MTVALRPELPADQAAIRLVNRAAFGGDAEARIVDQVRGTDRWIEGGSIVATTPSGEVVGHLLLSEGDLRAADGSVRRIWLLGPVAVLPARQGRGVGSALMRAAIELAVERRQPLIALLGHADYYPRFGFEPARAIGLEPPAAWPDDHWLALRLPGWTPELSGRVGYPPAFGVG